MTKPHWLTVRNETDHAEILIQGPIGSSFWDDSGISEKEFTNELAKIPAGKKITIGINSEGGSIKDGLGIYNAIKRRASDITARIDGYAVSIASVIPLAASRVVSPKSSIWMIHEPWSMTAGNAEDHLKAAAMLEKHAETLTGIYAEETGKDADNVRNAMKDETWFTGEEAVAFGLADEMTEDEIALNSIDLKRFKNFPASLLARIGAPVNAGTVGTTTAEDKTERKQSMADETKTATAEDKKTTATIPQPRNDGGTDNLRDTILLKSLEVLDRISERLDRPQVTMSTDAPGAAPVGGQVQVTREGLRDLLADKKTPKARFEFLRDEWNALQQARIPLYPVAANTDSASGALTTAILADGLVTVLQNRLAPLTAFTRDFSPAPMIGRNVIQVPKVTAGGTAQSNPTSFEDSTNFVGTVANIAITPAHIVSGAHITNAEQQNGWRMAWWVEIKAQEFAEKIKSLCNAIITTGNFTATPVTAAAVAFGASELKTLWGTLKKAPAKYIMLDGEYYAQFLPANLESFNPLQANTYPGWAGFFQDDYWTGATSNTTGFACNPQAIAVGAALPPELPNMQGASNLASQTITIPGIGLSVANYTWFSTSSRTGWWTVDAMFGAALGDGTAGVLVKSA